MSSSFGLVKSAGDEVMHLDDSRLASPQHGYIERVCFRSIGEGFNHLLYGGSVRYLPRVAGIIF